MNIKEMTYTIEDLFQSVNDIYEQYDEGKITQRQAEEILLNCCRTFVKDNNHA